MASTYDVTAISPRTRSVGGGVFRRVQEVTFTTKPSGIVGQVDIPLDGFTVETVDAAVAPMAARLEAVKAL